MKISIHSRAWLVGLAVSLLPLSVQGQLFRDPDPNWTEAEYVLPDELNRSQLRAFFVSAASPNRFLIDESTLSVGDDGVIRYTLVVQTPGGAENVTFEGIRCASAERRIYAMLRSDGSWMPARRSAWEAIIDNSYNRPHAALAFDYLCDGPAPPRSRDHALRSLRQSPRQLVR